MDIHSSNVIVDAPMHNTICRHKCPDTTITVANATGLDDPKHTSAASGVIYIRNERIEYLQAIENNTPLFRTRGTMGTQCNSTHKW